MKEQLIEKILEKYLLGDNINNGNIDNDNIDNSNIKNPFIGKYVIVRGHDAGVRCGKLIDGTKGNIILEDARNLWRRWCKEGIGLSGLASHGLADRDEVKILETQKKVLITDERVSTFFEVGKDVEKQLREYKTS